MSTATISLAKSEIGEIPADWQVLPLRALLTRSPRYGINAAAVPDQAHLPTYIRITDISNEGSFTPTPRVSVDHIASADYYLATGDIVAARTGASVGKSYLYNPADGQLVFAGFLICLSPDPNKIDSRFLSQSMQTRRYWDWVTRTSVRSGQPGINGGEYGGYLIAVPELAEQQLIASNIADVDALISALESLIAKRQAIKQGMMQQLFTGKTRLAGFSAKWRKTKFSALGRCIRGVAYNPELDLSSAATPETIQLLRSNNIQDSRIIFSNVQHVHHRRVSDDQLLRPNDVMICMANGSKQLVGKAARYSEENTAKHTFGAFMGVFRLNPGVADASFINYCFQIKQFRDWIGLILAGSSINNLRPRDIEEYSLELPEVGEQKAIAASLKDADAEIDALADELGKAKLIKKGMLQELLTGRTRLHQAEVMA
jgi:type I restriction enzyme S subunit